MITCPQFLWNILAVTWQNYLIIPSVFISSLAGAAELLMTSLSDNIYINYTNFSYQLVFPDPD